MSTTLAPAPRRDGAVTNLIGALVVDTGRLTLLLMLLRSDL
jgi:hypothetical protein